MLNDRQQGFENFFCFFSREAMIACQPTRNPFMLKPADRLRISVFNDRYQSRFVTPRASRHHVMRDRFAPLNLISRTWQGATLALRAGGADLIHAHNRIPLNPIDFVISFESRLPRYFGPSGGRVENALVRRLAGKRCRRILPMSEFARRQFFARHEGAPELAALSEKITLRYPNIEIPGAGDALVEPENTPWTLTFVGGDFARKGGCVVVKAAELARARDMPLQFEVISSLTVGGAIWTDPTNTAFFEPYLKGLDAPNIRHRPGLPNAEVCDLLARSHFSVLPTFGDTFGFSAMEAMARYTPVIGTTQAALPEFIHDGENGILLDLETDDIGYWKTLDYGLRGTPEYEAFFAGEVDRLALDLIERVERYLNAPKSLGALRRAARRTAEQMFDAEQAASFLDDLYRDVVAERRR